MSFNFDYEEKETRSQAHSHAIKMREKEREVKQEGWKWVQLDRSTKVLVSCDKNGHPTQSGEIKLKRWRECVLL